MRGQKQRQAGKIGSYDYSGPPRKIKRTIESRYLGPPGIAYENCTGQKHQSGERIRSDSESAIETALYKIDQYRKRND